MTTIAPKQVKTLEKAGETLLSALETLVSGLGGKDARPTDVAREFGVHVSLASRMLKSLRTPDTVAALGSLPGAEAMRQFVAPGGASDAASRRAAARAIDSFEEVVRGELGGREGLEAFLSVCVPEQRTRHELKHKQAAYRAMANLMGVSARVDMMTLILWPSVEKENRLHAVNIRFISGLRQRRPGGAFHHYDELITPDPDTPRFTTISGRESTDPTDFVMWERTSIPREQIRAEHYPSNSVMSFDAGPMGGPEHQIAIGVRVPNAYFARPGSQGRSAGLGLTVAAPTEVGVIEILVADGAWSHRRARVVTHMLGPRGSVDPNDPARRADEINIHENAEPVDSEGFRLTEVPDHPGVIASVCERVRVDAASLKGFRVRSRYPLVGAQISLDILPPG